MTGIGYRGCTCIGTGLSKRVSTIAAGHSEATARGPAALHGIHATRTNSYRDSSLSATVAVTWTLSSFYPVDFSVTTQWISELGSDSCLVCLSSIAGFSDVCLTGLHSDCHRLHTSDSVSFCACDKPAYLPESQCHLQ
jgi:hypothetical protein